MVFWLGPNPSGTPKNLHLPLQASIQHVLKAGVFLPLAGFDKHGRWVYLIRCYLLKIIRDIRFGAIQPNSMKVDDLYKVALMLLDLALEENTQVTRLKLIKPYLI